MTKDRQTIGVVGYGFVGEAVAKGLAPVADVVVYDKAKGWRGFKEGEQVTHEDREYQLPDHNPASILVARCSIIFVCVPTPMRQDGSCSTEIVEEVVRGLNRVEAKGLNRGGDEKVEWSVTAGHPKPTVVIKSTVPPGTTARLQKECGWLDLVFNPEFLTEANSLRDFADMDRVILGGEPGTRGLRGVGELYEAFRNWQYGQGNMDMEIHYCPSTEAEMIKYLTNCFLACKVSLANEFAQVAEKVGADWDTVWGIASTDERLGESHWKVPGPDGKKGFGGSCFPKDVNGMIRFMSNNGILPHTLLGAWLKNTEVRPERDWEELKGRAVE